MFNKSKTIKLSAQIDLGTNKVTVNKITDPWTDYSYWLEVVSFMAFQAMHTQGWDKKKTIDNATQYITKALDDYDEAWSAQSRAK